LPAAQALRSFLGSVARKLAANDVSTAAQVLAEQVKPELAKASSGPRVFIQTRSKDQSALYDRCAALLRGAGVVVPKPELVLDKGPARTQLRYFHDADAEEARRLAQLFKGPFSREPTIVAVRGYDLVPPRQFELWLSPTGW
jgi:hypothetical protein